MSWMDCENSAWWSKHFTISCCSSTNVNRAARRWFLEVHRAECARRCGPHGFRSTHQLRPSTYLEPNSKPIQPWSCSNSSETSLQAQLLCFKLLMKTIRRCDDPSLVSLQWCSDKIKLVERKVFQHPTFPQPSPSWCPVFSDSLCPHTSSKSDSWSLLPEGD